ncbi:MAG: SDR family oxidoreductase [Bacteroidetes bacterium]|nr:SDR family oxidoreductase [Bacteroidota bacterium]
MKDKVVIITGASSGIGRSLASLYGLRGFRLTIVSRHLDKIEAVGNELRIKGVEVLALQADVAKEEDCRKMVEETLKKFGRIDILVNNAGISMRALFQDVNLDVIRRLMDTNFWGTVYCTKYALPHLIESKGTVVGVISVAGHIGLPGRTGYSASKFAVRGFLDALRVENLHTGLKVLVVAPGFTSSNIRRSALVANGDAQGATPRDESRMMSPDKVAKRIFRAVKYNRRQLILTFVEGKLAVLLKQWLPRVVDWQAYREMAKEPDSPFH